MFKIIQDSIILYKIVNLRYLLEIRRSYKPLSQSHLKHDVHVHTCACTCTLTIAYSELQAGKIPGYQLFHTTFNI